MKAQQRKWLPAVAVPAMIAALAVGGSLTANARTDLPDKTPDEVLRMVASHGVDAFSGQLRASFALGLPQLPGAGDGFHGGGPGTSGVPGEESTTPESASPDSGGGSASPGTGSDGLDRNLPQLFDLLSGTHEARIFTDGQDKQRFQLMDGADEKNLVRNGNDVWFYDSAENAAVHTTLPDDLGRNGMRHLDPERRGSMPTPEELADRFLQKAEANAEVTVEEGSSDSGRDVYTLRLDPRTEQTLVDAVTVDVDAETGVPLGVEVLAVDQEEPAVSVGFTEFTPEAPDAGLFDFQPPAGATVEERTLGQCKDRDGLRDRRERGEQGQRGDRSQRGDNQRGDRQGRQWMWDGDGRHARGDFHRGDLDPAARGGQVVGEGWEAVVVLDADRAPKELTQSEVLGGLATEVDGGRLLGTPLLNVLLADDGRVLAGSVPVERLQEVAGETAR